MTASPARSARVSSRSSASLGEGDTGSLLSGRAPGLWVCARICPSGFVLMRDHGLRTFGGAGAAWRVRTGIGVVGTRGVAWAHTNWWPRHDRREERTQIGGLGTALFSLSGLLSGGAHKLRPSAERLCRRPQFMCARAPRRADAPNSCAPFSPWEWHRDDCTSARLRRSPERLGAPAGPAAIIFPAKG